MGVHAGSVRGQLFRRLGQLEQEIQMIKTALGLARPVSPPPGSPGVPADVEVGMYQLIAELATDLVTIHTSDGTCVFASPNSVAFFGWEPHELIGTSFYGFCHPDDVAPIADAHAERKELGSEAVQSITYRLRTKSGDYRWVEARCRASPSRDGDYYIVCITRDIHDQHVAREKAHAAERALASRLTHLALTDELTGLANRRAGEVRLVEEMRRAERSGQPLSLLMLDLDHFKAVNDTHGHRVGDNVLRETAHTITRVVRSYDTSIRWGGEEFLIIMPDVDASNAVGMGERILSAIREHRIDLVGTVTASGGVAQYVVGEDLDHLVGRADDAMYAAKNAGRDQVQLAL